MDSLSINHDLGQSPIAPILVTAHRTSTVWRALITPHAQGKGLVGILWKRVLAEIRMSEMAVRSIGS